MSTLRRCDVDLVVEMIVVSGFYCLAAAGGRYGALESEMFFFQHARVPAIAEKPGFYTEQDDEACQ